MSFVEKYGKKPSTKTAEKKKSALDTVVKSSNADLVYLVKGIDDNRSAWYYVLVERLKVSLFLKALNADIIHLEDYGKILYSAYGDNPPKDITDKVKEEYGVSD